MENIQKRDITNIFTYWCKHSPETADTIMSDDDSKLIPWRFTGKGLIGVMFKCAGSEFPLSILTCKANGAKWHSSAITPGFILKFRETVRNFQLSDTPIEILRLQDMFDMTRFECRFYERLKTLQARGAVAFYQKVATLRAKIETVFIQTGTVSADLITEFEIQTTPNLRDDLTKLVCFPATVFIRISTMSEKQSAVLASATVSAVTARDAAAMLFFSDLPLDTFLMPCNIKYK